MALIEMRDVNFTYAYADAPALQGVNLVLQPGLLYGVVGRNASGKSTLCNVMRGIVPNFHDGELTGDVDVLGTPLRDWDPAELSRRIGYVFQNPFTQISGIRDTVFEEIALGLEHLGVDREQMIARVIEVVHELGIEALVEKDPNGLSGGQRQKVAFASILAMDADVLVIDEPTSQLDPESTEEVFAIIRRLKEKGKSIILVEHSIDLLAEYVDRIIVLDGGRVTAEGPAQDVLTSPALDAAGVPRPEVTEIAHRLEAQGRGLDTTPITKDAARTVLSARLQETSRDHSTR
ncbi:ABC transporter ATP-binding protein [Brachybacterium vulturis]|uniref:ABC transporter ATP-binding protein n=1 Tax=Brachybacterium vulturis TaxID=2017484 RepID=A0A291GS36_9MICO|nr:ABC transporter ATP-binding protein [Brachybacterium vulturis]ATG53007.1 ABC transporter ATP-binding protein [Brachybacterium vulturis]